MTRRIATSPRRAWEAISRGESWAHWVARGARVNFTVGGRYSTPEGDTGLFRAIKPFKMARFTWENPKYTAGSFVMYELSPEADGKITVGLTHGRIGSDTELKQLKKSWGEALNRLRDWLESEQEPPARGQLSQAASRRSAKRGRT